MSFMEDVRLAGKVGPLILAQNKNKIIFKCHVLLDESKNPIKNYEVDWIILLLIGDYLTKKLVRWRRTSSFFCMFPAILGKRFRRKTQIQFMIPGYICVKHARFGRCRHWDIRSEILPTYSLIVLLSIRGKKRSTFFAEPVE